MQQLTLIARDACRWDDVADPPTPGPLAAIVRPIAVACCDLDVAVAQGRLPMPAGHALGHEGIAELGSGW